MKSQALKGKRITENGVIIDGKRRERKRRRKIGRRSRSRESRKGGRRRRQTSGVRKPSGRETSWILLPSPSSSSYSLFVTLLPELSPTPTRLVTKLTTLVIGHTIQMTPTIKNSIDASTHPRRLPLHTTVTATFVTSRRSRRLTAADEVE